MRRNGRISLAWSKPSASRQEALAEIVQGALSVDPVVLSSPRQRPRAVHRPIREARPPRLRPRSGTSRVEWNAPSRAVLDRTRGSYPLQSHVRSDAARGLSSHTGLPQQPAIAPSIRPAGAPIPPRHRSPLRTRAASIRPAREAPVCSPYDVALRARHSRPVAASASRRALRRRSACSCRTKASSTWMRR